MLLSGSPSKAPPAADPPEWSFETLVVSAVGCAPTQVLAVRGPDDGKLLSTAIVRDPFGGRPRLSISRLMSIEELESLCAAVRSHLKQSRTDQ